MPKTADMISGCIGSIKHLASRVPGVGELIAGFDSYNRTRFERETKEFLDQLDTAVANIESVFNASWYSTEEGDQYARKVIDCALDAQLNDKKELFVNALINGAILEEMDILEKLKFVDILRQLSKASLAVLAEMHTLFEPDTRRPGKDLEIGRPYPQVDQKRIAEQLSYDFDPYLVEAALCELESHGLFSSTGDWRKKADGSSIVGGGFMDALAYTDFTCRFVEFITAPSV